MENPFEKGRSIVFHSKSTTNTKRYMNSTPGGADHDRSISVYMSESVDFKNNPGCYWQIIPLDDNKVRLKTLSSSSDKRILDSSGAADRNISVYLADDSAGTGSHWTPIQHSDGSYSMRSDTPSGTARILKANPSGAKHESVYLVESSELVAVDTQWNIGMSYHSEEEVKSSLSGAFAGGRGVFIVNHFVESTRMINYGSMDYNSLKRIWDDSKLADYRLKEDKFNDFDFAVCLKAHVAKHSYDTNLPDGKGSLCGILSATIDGKKHALNFTIDIFGNLIIFDPQNGHHVDASRCTPIFGVL